MKILLADDHRLIREGLRAIVEQAGLRVVGEAGTGREAVARSRELRPRVVLMDVAMPDLNGVDATRQIVAESPETKVIGLSMHADKRYVLAMFAAGAVGYLLKNAASDELIQALHAVDQGLTYVSPAIASSVVDVCVDRTSRPPAKQALSAREREVLQLLAEGHSSKEIAARLELALPTIETHRRQIMSKLELHSIAALTKYAIREGLTQLE